METEKKRPPKKSIRRLKAPAVKAHVERVLADPEVRFIVIRQLRVQLRETFKLHELDAEIIEAGQDMVIEEFSNILAEDRVVDRSFEVPSPSFDLNSILKRTIRSFKDERLNQILQKSQFGPLLEARGLDLRILESIHKLMVTSRMLQAGWQKHYQHVGVQNEVLCALFSKVTWSHPEDGVRESEGVVTVIASQDEFNQFVQQQRPRR